MWSRLPPSRSSSLRSCRFSLVPGRVHATSHPVRERSWPRSAWVAATFLPDPCWSPWKCEARSSPAPIARISGRFGFYNLAANEYMVTVNDDAYEPFSATVERRPHQDHAMNFVQITLSPARRRQERPSPRPGRGQQSLPRRSRRLLPPVPQERRSRNSRKGVDADHEGNPDEAIEHYQKALELFARLLSRPQ